MGSSAARCDCLNDCGDDPWLADGRVQPCEWLQRRMRDREAATRREEARAQLLRELGHPDDPISALAELRRLRAGLHSPTTRGVKKARGG